MRQAVSCARSRTLTQAAYFDYPLWMIWMIDNGAMATLIEYLEP